jgi:hypothetical protein
MKSRLKTDPEMMLMAVVGIDGLIQKKVYTKN